MLLEVRNLRVGIRRRREFFPAVDGVSFSIGAGEITGLVGESGCGKTLTSLAVPGLLPEGVELVGGEVVFNGARLNGLPERELCAVRGKDIAMIFQEPLDSLNPLQKVKTQVIEPLLLHGEKNRKEALQKVLAVMESLNLSEPERILEMYPHQLSGGICQRVMIALAVITGPKLLIADEPTTALDAQTGGQILALLKRVNHTRGTAILFISHDLRLVRRFCGRVMVMYAGKLVEEGSAEDIFSHPLHEYTKGLLGALPGKEKRGRPLAGIPGRVPPLEEDRPPGCPFAPRCAGALPECAAAFPDARGVNGHWALCLRAELPSGGTE